MHTDAADSEIPCSRSLRIQSPRIANRHSELVFVQASRDVWMGFSSDVWIHAQGDGGRLVQPSSTFGERPQFRLALDVEQKDTRLQSCREFFPCFADSRKDDFHCCFAMGDEYSLQFASRDNVESASSFRQEAQQRQVRISFYRIADCVGYFAKGSLKIAQPFFDRGRRINIEGRTVLFSQRG